MLTMLTTLFATVFDRDTLLRRARQLRAVERVRELHPADVLLALVRSAVGDEHPGLATARRQLYAATGFMPEESSFYERITPGFGDLGWDVFLQALAKATRVQRRQVAKALGLRVRDVRAIDASVVTLPERASPHLPSTDSKLGGFKITAVLSVMEDLLISAHITDARQHDRKALVLPKAAKAVLHLMDRGYSDHRLFAEIADRGGYFIIRLKSCSQPEIETIRDGIAKMHLGKPLSRQLPVWGFVDMDARFKLGGEKTRTFRVVAVPVAKNKAGEPDWIWLATNLPASVAAKTVGTFYRLRWSIESLFRALKGVGRLDEIQSANPAVLKSFIAATLIGLVLSQSICASMRAERPRCVPSLLRVFKLLLANIGQLANAFGTPAFKLEIERFVAALWREGVNPNPGRPYALQHHLCTVGE